MARGEGLPMYCLMSALGACVLLSFRRGRACHFAILSHVLCTRTHARMCSRPHSTHVHVSCIYAARWLANTQEERERGRESQRDRYQPVYKGEVNSLGDVACRHDHHVGPLLSQHSQAHAPHTYCRVTYFRVRSYDGGTNTHIVT